MMLLNDLEYQNTKARVEGLKAVKKYLPKT